MESSHSHSQSQSMLSLSNSEKTEWTWEENKKFENALAELDLESPHLFELIALRVPGKSLSQIKEHYNALVEDIQLIEADLVPLPNYKNNVKGKGHVTEAETRTHNKTVNKGKGRVLEAEKKTSNQSRKKGIPWTSEEHELFLQGLQIYGRGDWRSISRHCVRTKTPIQIASHAQKHFIRLQKQNSGANNKVDSASTPNNEISTAANNTACHQLSSGSSFADASDIAGQYFPSDYWNHF